MAPVEAFKVRPLGREPADTENVYGEAPPVTVMAGLLNARPTSPVVELGQVRLGPATILNGQVRLATEPRESFTWRVKLPAAAGVPVTAPVEALRVSPAGRLPLDTENVYGAVPPVTAIAGLLKATPASPCVFGQEVTDGPLAMVMEQVADPVAPAASFTWMLKLPATCGVPVTAPVEALSVNLAGRVPTTENV